MVFALSLSPIYFGAKLLLWRWPNLNNETILAILFLPLLGIYAALWKWCVKPIEQADDRLTARLLKRPA